MNMPHAVTAYLVADPVQDYEETLEVWGVYGSLDAARVGARLGREAHYSGHLAYLRYRDTEITRWVGHRLTDIWTYSGDTGRWAHRPGPDHGSSGSESTGG